jgi:hypothetical protein
VIARRPLSRFIQIDRLVTVLTGAGSQTTPAFYVPHARYTVFVDAEPARAARSFAFLNKAGDGVRDDWSRIPDDVINVPVPLVQHELPAGNYEMTIQASPACSWQAQVVLNSMLSWAAPPPAWRPSRLPPDPLTLGSGGSPDFRIEQTGSYQTDFTINGFTPRIAWRVEKSICPFQLSLRPSGGHLVYLGGGKEKYAHWPGGAFLGAGNWNVEIETDCPWELTIRPMVGPGGGGARWF